MIQGEYKTALFTKTNTTNSLGCGGTLDLLSSFEFRVSFKQIHGITLSRSVAVLMCVINPKQT